MKRQTGARRDGGGEKETVVVALGGNAMAALEDRVGTQVTAD